MKMREFVFLVITILRVLGSQDERVASVLAASDKTISQIRSILCGRINKGHVPVFGFAVGADREEGTKKLLQEFQRALGSVAKESGRRLAGANSLDEFDFRVFDNEAAAVGPSIMAYWQELIAAYPKARLVVFLGDQGLSSANITACAEMYKEFIALKTFSDAERWLEITTVVEERIAAYGSACPTPLQMAKFEDAAVREIEARRHFLNSSPPQGSRGSSRILFITKDQVQQLRNFLLQNDTYNEKKNTFSWRPRLQDAFSRIKESDDHHLIICPGAGATATKSLAQALALSLPAEYIDHNHETPSLLQLASEVEHYDWEAQFSQFGAVLDTPIPGYWRELYESFPNSKVILTTRDLDFHRDYSGGALTPEIGLGWSAWRLGSTLASTAMALHQGFATSDEVNRTKSLILHALKTQVLYHTPRKPRGEKPLKHDPITGRKLCDSIKHCRAKCMMNLTRADATISAGYAQVGDSHCKLARHVDEPVFELARFGLEPAAALANPDLHHWRNFGITLHNPLPYSTQRHRLSIYRSHCPSKIATLKAYNNINAQVVRVVEASRLLVMDITQGDGFDVVCPFLFPHTDSSAFNNSVCATDGASRRPFPHSKEFIKDFYEESETKKRFQDKPFESRRFNVRPSSLAKSQDRDTQGRSLRAYAPEKGEFACQCTQKFDVLYRTMDQVRSLLKF